jgi:hypothetical protein
MEARKNRQRRLLSVRRDLLHEGPEVFDILERLRASGASNAFFFVTGD